MRLMSKSSFFLLSVLGLLQAQQYNVSLEKNTGYSGWINEWGMVYIVKNDIVTVAVVPKLGGRVMQYSLGNNGFFYIHNPQQMPSDGNDIVGGFRVLPSPQSDFVWPSPPNLDFNPYTCTEVNVNGDSVVLLLESQVENSTETKYQKHKGLQFKRFITVYKASTRVKVEMVMLNKGTQNMTHGIWDITQTACPEGADCWVYFKRNPSSTLGRGRGYVQYMHEGTDSSQWKPNAAEGGIMGVHYLKKVGKIGADCREGWICFNNRTSGYVYVKTFDYQNGKTYPDSGASVQVYTYSNYNVLEVEVLGPLVNLAPGDSTILVENWYACRGIGPVLAVNRAGLVTKKLSALRNDDTIKLTGTFGVFYPGVLKTMLCNEAGTVISTYDSTSILPGDSVRIDKRLAVPASAAGVKLALFDRSGTFIGSLDSVAFPPTAVTSGGRNQPAGITGNNNAGIARLLFSKNRLTVDITRNCIFSAELFSINGKLLRSYEAKAPYTHVFNLSSVEESVFVLKVRGRMGSETHIVCPVH